MSFFSDLFGSNNLYSQAAAAQQQGLNAGYSQAQPLIQQAENTTTQYGNTAAQPFQQAYASNSAGAQQLQNALGFGGASGNA
ncbi:MAG: hypothetical protein WBQ55_19375, partial [Xanthobacteraceae bacterium]